MSDYLPRQHILTVEVEDYFQTPAFTGIVRRASWSRYQSRLEAGTIKTLDLLDEFGAKATFFTLGWAARAAPGIIRLIVERGHEVAALSYYHQSFREFTRREFRADAIRARDTLEQVTEQKVLGFRIADGRLRPQDLWALKVLQDLGFSYDSSLRLMFREWSKDHIRGSVQRTRMPGPEFWEVPVSSLRFFGLDLPVGGGNYFRQLPPGMMQRAVARWIREHRAPFVMYFHTWELDPEQPRLPGASMLGRVRQYRNLDRMPELLAHYLTTYRFTSIAEYLRLEQARLAEQQQFPAVGRTSGAVASVPRTAVTIVVPCYNVEFALPRLVNLLQKVRAKLADRYHMRAILIDDASTDGTWEVMSRLFAWDEDARCYRQPIHLGTATTILRAVRDADTDIVCSMDAECAYDPYQLGTMLPLLTDGVDVVTASPYHPSGEVKKVRWWRQAVPRVREFLYRRAFRHRLHTYSSVFRVYRRSAVVEMPVLEDGVVGVTEMLGRLEQTGARIVECPVVREGPEAGGTFWEKLRTAVRHLRLMARLTARRLWG